MVAQGEPVVHRPGARLEGYVRPRNAVGRPRANLETFRRRARLAAHDPRFPRQHDDRGLRAAVDADDLGRLDDQAGLLERLAHRTLLCRLVDLEKAAGLRPRTVSRLDPAPDQDQVAGVGHGQRADDDPRVHVMDEAAAVAHEPVARFRLEGAEVERLSAARTEIEACGKPRRNAGELAATRAHAKSSAIASARLATRIPTRTAAQTKRNRPRPRSTGSHVHAERHTRTAASAEIGTSRIVAISAGKRTMGELRSPPNSSAVMATIPAKRTMTDR